MKKVIVYFSLPIFFSRSCKSLQTSFNAKTLNLQLVTAVITFTERAGKVAPNGRLYFLRRSANDRILKWSQRPNPYLYYMTFRVQRDLFLTTGNLLSCADVKITHLRIRFPKKMFNRLNMYFEVKIKDLMTYGHPKGGIYFTEPLL